MIDDQPKDYEGPLSPDSGQDFLSDNEPSANLRQRKMFIILGLLTIVVGGLATAYFVVRTTDVPKEASLDMQENQGPAHVASVFDTYCGPQLELPSFEDVEETSRMQIDSYVRRIPSSTNIASSSVEAIGLLDKRLSDKDYENKVELSFMLLQQGQNYVNDNQLDEGLNYHRCAAEVYYNPLAMYRLAQVYRYGTDELSDGIELQTDGTVQKDDKRALFWALSAISVDRLKIHTEIVSNPFHPLGYNAQAIVDTIVNAENFEHVEEVGTAIRLFSEGKRPVFYTERGTHEVVTD